MTKFFSAIKTRSVGLALASALFAASALTPAFANDDPIVAKVNGEEIHRSALEQLHATIPYLKGVPLEHVYDTLLESLVSMTAVASEARKAGLENDPMVQRNITAATRQILRSVYLTREIDKQISDDQLRKDYDAWKKENPPQEEVSARHILVKTEKDARDLIKSLDKGEDFATLAKAKSTGPSASNGGDLGFFKRTDMVKPFADVAFDLKPGTYSKEPLKTQFGWHVIKVEDRRTAEVPTFEEMEPRLRDVAAGKIVQQVEKDLTEKAKIERFAIDGSAKK